VGDEGLSCGEGKERADIWGAGQRLRERDRDLEKGTEMQTREGDSKRGTWLTDLGQADTDRR
jgi:hypothetical protein